MRTNKKEVRATLKKAEDSIFQLGEADKDPKIWFKKTETFANKNEKEQALRSLCMATYLLFTDELGDPNDREDIISQTAHQFHAYGKVRPSRKSRQYYRGRRKSVKK